MPSAQSIRDQLLAVPQPIVNGIEAVAKAAGDEDGATDEAMAAMRAAGRILAPHADNITSEQMTKLMQAIGMMAQDADDKEAEDEDVASNAEDAAIEAQESATNKAADADDDDDEEEDEAQKSATDKPAPAWLKAKIKGGGKKDDADADAEAEGDDADADDDDDTTAGAGKKKQPMTKASSTPVSHARAIGYDNHAPRAEAPSPLEMSVTKSTGIDLKGFTEAQKAALEPILKSHGDMAKALESHRTELKEAVAKAQAAQHKLDRKEFIAKAATLPHLGAAESLGEKLHNLHAKDPEGFEDYFNILKTANAASDSSPLFQERGSRLGAPDGIGQQVQAAVAQIQKSGNMTAEQAEAQFYKTAEGKRAYAEHYKEARAGRGRN